MIGPKNPRSMVRARTVLVSVQARAILTVVPVKTIPHVFLEVGSNLRSVLLNLCRSMLPQRTLRRSPQRTSRPYVLKPPNTMRSLLDWRAVFGSVFFIFSVGRPYPRVGKNTPTSGNYLGFAGIPAKLCENPDPLKSSLDGK